MRTSQRAIIAIVVALGALVVATVASASPADTDPVGDQPTSTPVGPGGGGPGMGTPQVVEPTPGMDNVRPTAFDTATIGNDDTTLTIVFWSGVEPCSVLDHVTLSYAADTVTVTLFQGSDPNAGDVACIDIAVQKQVTITLDEPLAGRQIVDGAA